MFDSWMLQCLMFPAYLLSLDLVVNNSPMYAAARFRNLT